MPNSNSQGNQSPAQQTASTGNGKGHTLVYAAIILVVIIVIGALFLIGSNGSALSATTTLPQSNSPPIYMGGAQAQTLLGAPVNFTANYTTTSIYNLSSYYNVTYLESAVPALSGNLTNGWETIAFGSSSNNASMGYTVIQTNNASAMSGLLAQGVSSSLPTLPAISRGTTPDGMNYTYETYSNSSGTVQNLVGWKGGYVAWVQIYANSFVSNQTQIAAAASSPIP